MQAPITILSPADPRRSRAIGQPADSTKLFPFPWIGHLHEAIPASPGDETKATVFLAGIARQLSPPEGLLLWIAEAAFGAEYGELYIPGLASFGFDPGNVILVRARTRVDALWAAEQGLRKGAIVLLELGARKALDLTLTRRLALAAEAQSATALLMRGDLVGAPPPPSAAWTRWQIASAPARTFHPGEFSALALTATLLRHRERPGGQRFHLEWMCDECAFHIEALGGGLATPADNRPHQARAQYA